MKFQVASLLFMGSYGSPSSAFTPRAPVTGPVHTTTNTNLLTPNLQRGDYNYNDPSTESATGTSSRRQWLSGVASAVSAGTLVGLNTSPAGAVDIVSSPALCDPTVSVWQRDGRVLYLLGTAHISTTSAELAGQLVRDSHPDAVFVELDLKRIGGSSTMAKQMEATGQQFSISSSDNPDAKPSRVMISPVGRTTSANASASPGMESSSTAVATADAPAPAAVEDRKPKSGGGGGFLGGLAGAVVGKGIKGMYSKLGAEGFNPGEEFIVAIKEGQKQGSAIVLGDRDVDVTLRRMAQALQQTDLNNLMNPDSELEQSMRQMLPSSSGSTSGMTEKEAFKTEMTQFVETMKTKENVKQIMALMEKEAPALYRVMVSERDAYMAAGLDTLNEFSVITAVFGLAHMDGIERNLRSGGWKQIPIRCQQQA